MNALRSWPWNGIKAEAALDVKTALLIWTLALLSPSLEFAKAEDLPADGEITENIPDIRAKDYAVKIVRRSNSNRTYLMDDVTEGKPVVGRIILLKREARNIMAFQILKTYPEKSQFAAKRVRRYGDHRILESGEQFRCIEKVADVTPPPHTEEDRKDLDELEADPSAAAASASAKAPTPGAPLPDTVPFDPELDTGSSPPPEGGVDSENAKSNPSLEEEADDLNDITVDEVHPIEVNSHSMSAQFGFFRNNASSGGSAYFAGAGLRYALTIGKMILLRRAQVQDSLAIELGAFLYKAIHFDVANDAYTILPLVGTLRYNVLLSENFGVFLYGGMVKSQVTSSAQATDSALGALSQAMPAAGGGLIFRVGPNWDARVDLGIDMIGGGLMLRF